MSIIKEFFYMPKSDRRSIVAILTAITLISIAIFALNFVGLESNPIDEEKHGNAANDHASQNTTYDNEKTMQAKAELFVFDPNTADSTQLLRLGLRPWQVRNIYKYRAKGGVYRTKEDFAFVYGLTVKEYRRLAPYIKISEDYRPASTLAEVRKHNRYDNYGRQYGNPSNTLPQDANTTNKPQAYTPKIHKGEHIAINASDTSSLKTIPGIGSYFAKQTVRYRDQLGGFVNKKQLLEIENFPEEALEYIKIDNENVKKLNVNKLTLSQLRRHPYINYYQARAITDYRRLHGSIKSMTELKLMKEFTEFDLQRIEPYIEY